MCPPYIILVNIFKDLIFLTSNIKSLSNLLQFKESELLLSLPSLLKTPELVNALLPTLICPSIVLSVSGVNVAV